MKKLSSISSRIIAAPALLLCMLLLAGCTYDRQPPKTSDAAKDYIIPAGEIPSAEELAAQKAAREFYQNSIKQQ